MNADPRAAPQHDAQGIALRAQSPTMVYRMGELEVPVRAAGERRVNVPIEPTGAPEHWRALDEGDRNDDRAASTAKALSDSAACIEERGLRAARR